MISLVVSPCYAVTHITLVSSLILLPVLSIIPNISGFAPNKALRARCVAALSSCFNTQLLRRSFTRSIDPGRGCAGHGLSSEGLTLTIEFRFVAEMMEDRA